MLSSHVYFIITASNTSIKEKSLDFFWYVDSSAYNSLKVTLNGKFKNQCNNAVLFGSLELLNNYLAYIHHKIISNPLIFFSVSFSPFSVVKNRQFNATGSSKNKICGTMQLKNLGVDLGRHSY